MNKILLVEDETELLSIMKDWLNEDYFVEAVSNGESALEALQQGEFDVLILDWMLPGISGIDICRKYRHSGGKAAVLITTAKKSNLSKESALAAGADAYLSKPFKLKELSERIKTLTTQDTNQISLLQCVQC